MNFPVIRPAAVSACSSDSQRMTDLADDVAYGRSGLRYQAQSLE